jgi:hypothetical protein
MILGMFALLSISASEAPFPSAGSMDFLREMTRAVVEESRVAPNGMAGKVGPNSTGCTIIRPGGRDCYPAFWIRDYAMSLESGMITPEEQREMLLLAARHQRETDWNTPSGSFVPAGAIVDHVSLNDKPIYYAGTLDDFEGQGGPRWGRLPCLDDHYFFVHMAFRHVRETQKPDILNEVVAGRTLWDRLEAAFNVPPSRPDTGLVYATKDNRGVTFGFTDCISHTGDLLFCSLLKYQAAGEMREMASRRDDKPATDRYNAISNQLRKAINESFVTPSGWLKASTGLSAQPDVWATAFAVHAGVLGCEKAKAACEVLLRGYKEGRIAWKGNIRHVPTDADFSEKTAWESSLAPLNTYQNGAYWGTPVGWVCFAIAQVDMEAARELAEAYIAELRDGDYRKGPEFGSPWECMHPDKNHRQNPVYMTSVTCPYALFQEIRKSAFAETK